MIRSLGNDKGSFRYKAYSTAMAGESLSGTLY